ncbi:single-stranded DNA-binding protein [Shewanella gelidii]|uniref:Single-stranded DNA-binding protein n=1 Tax=Shewanella gelidii TaxID=1642821 RepID=A0A917K224_9GAMM|nr:single-stranded DNA-binding protein [Shewanella gelidii]MCL1098080.1 G5P family DNA-binding protein [Shewanella gelidii]MCL1098087.1 G5P family DNA-binding protein [Shewanella gelidii]GGI93582.1 hypothetical protein GCM10009332_33520 [Shewanella gelidii]
MLIIEVFPEHLGVKSRSMPGKDGKPGRAIHEQIAYAYLGGKFPVEMKLQVESPADAYPAGKYQIDSSSFIVNNFGGLELKRFGLTISPVEKHASSDAVKIAK